MRLLGNVNWWMPARLKRLLPPLAALMLIGPLVLACDANGRVLSNPTPIHPTVPPASPTLPPAVDPQPVVFPRDEAAHDRLTEWWYYTGHLVTPGQFRYDFEFVVFRAERGSFPVSWASHLALTDRSGDQLLYEQRSEIGPQVDVSAESGFDLRIHGSDDSGIIDVAAPAWEMAGLGGSDAISATADDFAIELLLSDTRDAPVLHNNVGWIDFGDAGSSYYYSRPRMAASGTLHVGGHTVEVTGEAWFDHQWGDFIAVGGGGWDWFAVNLSDGTDLTLSLVRAADGTYPLVYGTLVRDTGETVHLSRDEFTVTSLDTWRSFRTGAIYPSGWTIEVPAEELVIDLRPTVLDQELDTRETTGVIYWEGSQWVTGKHGPGLRFNHVVGNAYVELTGYAP
jgi:predicted secreted hydrolase